MQYHRFFDILCILGKGDNTCTWKKYYVADLLIYSHTMDLLWEKFQWILPLYMKPISFQSKASVVCSVTAAIFIDFCLKKLNVSSQHVGQKTNEYLNSAEQITRNWNVDQLSVLITSWDITQWCSINLLWKELMERMSEHTGLISSLSLLLVQTQAARWKAATPEQLTGAHLYLDIAQVRLPLSCIWECYVLQVTVFQSHGEIRSTESVKTMSM